MLLPDLHDAERPLQRIYAHLAPAGHAVVPLYVPPLPPEAKSATDQWRIRESVRESDGATLRLSEECCYDVVRRLRVATLRYEVIRHGEVVGGVERPWVLQWYSQEEFRRLLVEVGVHQTVVLSEDGKSVTEDPAALVFVASRPSRP